MSASAKIPVVALVWSVLFNMLGFLACVLFGLGMVYLIAEVFFNWVLPSLLRATFFVMLFGAVGLAAWKLWQRYQADRRESQQREAVLRKLSLSGGLGDISELQGNRALSMGARDLLTPDGKPAWQKLGGFLDDLKGLSSFLSAPDDPEIRAALYRKSEPLLTRLVSEMHELQARVRDDVQLREKAQVTANLEKIQAEEAAARAKEETLRLEVERERLTKQSKLETFGLEDHIDGLAACLEAQQESPSPAQQASIWENYLRLQKTLETFCRVPRKERERIDKDELRLLQIRALLDRYTDLITEARRAGLSDEAAIWERLRDRDISALEGV